MDTSRHNTEQIEYFDRSQRATMVPVDSPYLNRHLDEILAWGKVERGARILEVGCGMGRYTHLLARRGHAVEGLDISEPLLRRMRSFGDGLPKIPLHCADIAAPPRELEGAFDVVLGLFALHHVHDLPACFQGIRRVLRPGGKVLFLEPNAYNPLFYLQVAFTPGMTWAGEGGIAKMRRGPLFSALRSAGFTRLSIARFGFFPPFLSNRAWGRRLESILERVSLWRPMLPFLMVRGDLE
jgi:SAM-dependent methyltransferase